MADDMDDRLRRVEDALWGPWRNNGLVSDVKAIRTAIEKQNSDAAAEEQNAKKDRVKNWLTAAGVMIAGASALLTAVITISQH